MKLTHLNTLADSFSNTIAASLQTAVEKGSLSKTEALSTEKEYVLLLTLEGQVNGYIGIGMEKELVLKIIEKMSYGQIVVDEINEMAISCVQEFGGMLKAKIINDFDEANQEIEVSAIDFLKKEELQEVNDIFVRVTAPSELGEFELNLRVN